MKVDVRVLLLVDVYGTSRAAKMIESFSPLFIGYECYVCIACPYLFFMFKNHVFVVSVDGANKVCVDGANKVWTSRLGVCKPLVIGLTSTAYKCNFSVISTVLSIDLCRFESTQHCDELAFWTLFPISCVCPRRVIQGGES